DGCEEDASHIVGGELIVSGCDAAPILEPAPEAFDEVSGAIGLAVVGDGRFAAAGRWDDDFGALGCDGGADGVAVVPTVGKQPVEAAAGRFDQRWGHRHVGCITGRDQQDAWTSGSVGQSVDLAGSSTARGADALREAPPFAPAAER